jgi:conjugative transfer region protein (TIGR03748 family)
MKEHKQLKRCLLSGLLCLSVLGATTTSFANNVSVGRYLSVAVKPQSDQQRLLQQQIQIKFPQNVLTIKQAVQFILQFSGYRLCDESQLSPPARRVLSQPLPEVDRTFGPMTLEQGLETLVGDDFYLLIDSVNRLVGLKIKPSYRHLYEKPIVARTIHVLRGSNHDNNE